MTQPARVLLGLIAATVTLTLLTACDPGSPAEPEGPPAPAPSDSASPAPVSPDPIDATPPSRVRASCDELAADSPISAAFSEPVSAVDPALSEAQSYPEIPVSAYIAQLGGLSCEWSNGGWYSDRRGTDPDYVGLRFHVMPDAAAQWPRFEATYGPAGRGFDCPGGPSYCSVEVLIGSNWYSGMMIGAVSSDAANTVFAGIHARLEAVETAPATWRPPIEPLAIPLDCPALVTDADVRSALGVTVPVTAARGGGGWSLGASAIVENGDGGCYWSFTDMDSGVGSLSVLPGGAWAWDALRDHVDQPSRPTEVATPGLLADESVWIRCAPRDAFCIIDISVGGNWIEVDVWGEDEMTPGRVTENRRDGAIAIATAIVAGIR